MQGDLVSGTGLDRAAYGTDTVIHCATSSLRRTRETDVEGTRRLLEAAARTGVEHVVFISIVGIDRVQSYPYYRAKLEAEKLVESSPIPHTILRATQFHDLVLTAMRFLDRLPVIPVPRDLLGQPIDAGEVADRLVGLALSKPAGRVPDVGGPEIRTPADAARGYLSLRGNRKPVLGYHLPGKTARAIRAGVLTCPDERYGEIRWEEFLRTELEEAGGPPAARGAS